MRRSWMGAAGRLLALQVVMGGLIYFLYGWPWVAAAGSLIFLALLWQMARQELSGRPLRERWAAAHLAQLPALIGSINFLLEQARLYHHSSLMDIFDFVMETYHTALLPLLAPLPAPLIRTFSGELLTPFFIALPFLSHLLIGWVLLASVVRRET